jgi:hypothetical protein
MAGRTLVTLVSLATLAACAPAEARQNCATLWYGNIVERHTVHRGLTNMWIGDNVVAKAGLVQLVVPLVAHV